MKYTQVLTTPFIPEALEILGEGICHLTAITSQPWANPSQYSLELSVFRTLYFLVLPVFLFGQVFLSPWEAPLTQTFKQTQHRVQSGLLWSDLVWFGLCMAVSSRKDILFRSISYFWLLCSNTLSFRTLSPSLLVEDIVVAGLYGGI